MSQKKLKRLRKLETVNLVSKEILEPVKGIRQIIKENWKFLIVMSVGIFLLYFNSLRGDFVSDDYATIPQNPQINDFWFMVKNTQSFSNYLIYKLFGFASPIAYHVFSLLIYIIFCLLVFIVIEVIFNNKRLSILTAAIFAVHPIHVEAVSWIAGRIYLILAIYIMLGFLAFVFYVKSNKSKYLLITLGSFILAFVTDKPRPFTLFLLMFLYLFYLGIEKVKIDWKKLIAGIFVLAIVFIVFAWPYVKFRIGAVNSGYNGSDGIFYNPFFQYPTGITKYLQLLLFPIDLTLYHTMYILPVWLNWIILLSYLFLLIYFFFKNKKYFFALGFILAAIIPSIMPVKVSWLVAERYMFLGSLGFCLFIALFFDSLMKKYKVISIIIFSLLLSIYSVRTFLRNIDWQTNHNLWVNTCQVSPNSHNAWNNIGDDYDKLAQLETTDEGKINQYLNSVKGFTRSTDVKPNYADAYHNRANIFYKIGRYDLARDSYETALSYGPNLYQSYYSLLQIDLTEKNFNLAINHLNKLDAVKPNDLQVYYTAAVVYANMGRADQAIPILEEIIKTSPDFKEAKTLLTSIKSQIK